METQSHLDDDSWREMQPVLDDALAALSDRDREALLLRFYRSLTIREIAATQRQNNHVTLAAASPTLGEALKAKVRTAPHPARFLLEDLK